MTTRLTIIAKNASGQVAALHIETEAAWQPLDVRDTKRMDGYSPDRLLDLALKDEIGTDLRHVTEDTWS